MYYIYIHAHICMYIYFFTYVFASRFLEHKYYILIYNKSDCLDSVSCVSLILTFEDLFLLTFFMVRYSDTRALFQEDAMLWPRFVGSPISR